MAITGGVDETNAIYYELSPKFLWLVRIVNAITYLMVMISIILTFVQGPQNNSYYLLVVNLLISAIVCSVVNFWYKTGDLGSEKFWFVLLICGVILFQCLTTDIFVFKKELEPHHPTTHAPTHTTRVVPWTSMAPPSTTP